MYPKVSDLILKSEIELYNNFVDSSGCTGRLQAKLLVQPSPRIIWDYEALGEEACRPEVSPISLTGISFFIEEAFITRRNYGRSPFHPPGAKMKGVASKANYNLPCTSFHSFRFYLPNAMFQDVNLVGQGSIAKYHRATLEEQSWEVELGTAGRFIRTQLDESWTLYMETQVDALNWLKNEESVGTLITTAGQLFAPKQKRDESDTSSMTLDEATSYLGKLSSLLSFANGGYIGPLYIEGYIQNEEDLGIAGVALGSRTTALEQIGQSWLAIDSNFNAYLQCFSTLSRMLAAPPWAEVWGLALIWYFQAIVGHRVGGKPWPIVANALGALLERLSVAILVRELDIRGLRGAKERIKRLLIEIGLDQDVRFVESFIDLRNDATHPTGRPLPAVHQLNQILGRATQWVEEVLLWRLGYDGIYINRIDHSRLRKPRYDLSLRSSEW